MKRFLVTFLLSALVIPTVIACTLPPGEQLTIGCSYECDFFYKLRLRLSARHLGYNLKIISLPEIDSSQYGLDKVDGVLVPGGADIDPRFYVDKVTPELRSYTQANLHLVKFTQEGRDRDDFEYELMSTYSQNEKFKKVPLLGICRGMQMMTVAQGMPLYLDIKTELGIKNRRYLFDRIFLEKTDSKIEDVYLNSTFKAFKNHHQGLRVPYWNDHKNEFPHLKVTGFSHNGNIAEVIEYQHRPAIGVQYHPEKSLTSASAPIMKWLLTKACEYKTSLKDSP
jgi:gamma-glutamyl-gamma-aminobutyrate hydrolase PuuD